MSGVNISQAVGRRKCAVARVYMRNGNGQISINGKKCEDYFKDSLFIYIVNQPIEACNFAGKYDFVVNVKGGGLSGQAGAVRHAIARALLSSDETLKDVLHKQGFLTRDSRMVERKKYGQRGARRRFQFSKR